MRKIFAAVTIVSLLCGACEKDSPEQSVTPGVYKGTFRRSLTNQTPSVTNVTLVLSADGKFEGTGEKLHYPDICNGSYSITKDSLSFGNGCVYTADFDWTLILGGKYRYEFTQEDSLVIYRSYPGIVYYFDMYSLKKQ